ncbi:hypothetical protein NA56DRAFT_692922 [Hyaloscypha hepaticicola]|uniref:CENP-V/GFA domain-containing protein n=1 Tax=Hyaloscypha hepaticicola TaxID=2082293 RepID=A0A2J6PQ75_9HELO|nr:hypothetical protein NA56DRAFT_692922 [Hyaloscypha hepaticicola]
MSSLSPNAFTLHGGCDCKSIRYPISIPELSARLILPHEDPTGAEVRSPEIFLEHCDKCRRVSGALLQAWLSCPQEWVEWGTTSAEKPPTFTRLNTADLTSSQPGNLPIINYASSERIIRSFCGKCGTNLLYMREHQSKENPVPMVDIVLGSLDGESLERQGVRPDRHFY